MNHLTFENLDGTELTIRVPENLKEISFDQLVMLQNPELTDFEALSLLSGTPAEDLYNVKSYERLIEQAKMYIEILRYAINNSNLDEIPGKINVLYSDKAKPIKLGKNLSIKSAGAYIAAKEIITNWINATAELFGSDWQTRFKPSLESCAAVVNLYLFCEVTDDNWDEDKFKSFDVTKKMSAFDVLAIAKYFFNKYPHLYTEKENPLKRFLKKIKQKITEKEELRQAMNIKVANALFDDSTFIELYKSGFITEKVFLYREIFLWINAQMEERGISKNQAVLEAVIKFDRSETTMWKVVKLFK